jgi:(p)ppGpp synthase/HD superfamily hydrolase
MIHPHDKNSVGFSRLAQLSFTKAAADTVLKAHSLATERFGPTLSDHLLAADTLLRQRADHVVVTAALLVPLRRYGCVEHDQILSLFGEVPALLTHRVLSADSPWGDARGNRNSPFAEETISEDRVRALILRIGLRLAELEVPAGQNGDGHRDLAEQTLKRYVPLADRLGIGRLRTRLEDICFRLLEPSAYDELACSTAPTRKEDSICFQQMKHGMRRLLERNGMSGTVCGRTKGLYSLHRKIQRLGCSAHDIMDRIGLRVIVSSVDECYAVLGLVHTRFRPVPGTLDDYIRRPKENGYQSLHTCIYPASPLPHVPVELQIRTESMHRDAEYGVVAHWLYKQSEAKTREGGNSLGYHSPPGGTSADQ